MTVIGGVTASSVGDATQARLVMERAAVPLLVAPPFYFDVTEEGSQLVFPFA
jgi:hypothetical protein